MPPPSTPEIDPEHPRAEPPASAAAAGPSSPGDAPLTFVPHDATGAVASEPVRIRTNRYGDMDAHELVRLLDSIEDERARGRFRESIYISVFVYVALAWLLLYGPRVLWHAPKLRLPSDVLHDRELTQLNAPLLLQPKLTTKPRPVPKPTLDNKTLEHLRDMSRRPAPPAPTPQPTPQPTPAPAASTPTQPLPAAPQPQPSRTPPPVVADAPTPQPSAHPSFNTGSASDTMRDIVRDSAHAGGGYPSGTITAPVRGGGSAGSGSTIISDTEGVDFSEWKRRFDRGTMNAWIPLLPEEIQPPLMKKGETYLLLTILPDGSIGHIALENSSRDEALDRAAWGSITSQGTLPPLPKAFHGPNIILRLHYMVNMEPR